jgi:radical SAM superfamily enzyme YgiQ (UPF0313 family)
LKVAFILPAIGKKKNQPYIRTWQIMEPLTISTLKALTPDDIETEFYDDRVELINYDSDSDLIAITTEVYTARRAYYIASEFKKRGKTVVFGGYHATLMPRESLKYGDAVVIGNAESVWEDVLEDYRNGELKTTYRGFPVFHNIHPDRSIFTGKKYSQLGVVETGRGCSFRCEFCAISSYYDGCYTRKPVDIVIEDLKQARAAGKKVFFFSDDNIVADQEFAIELFKALVPLKIKWSGQGSLTMAANSELLYWMKKSGCTLILIGYESLDNENLKQMKKAWVGGEKKIRELTKAIHKAGINIYATFLFGFDNDSLPLYEKTLKFTRDMRFYCVAFNHLLPMPGTPLHSRLEKEGRLLDNDWWLLPDYLYGDLIFHPKGFSPEEISGLCRQYRKKFYTLPSIIQRSFTALFRTRNILLYIYYWYINIKLRIEVDGKIGIPVGDNLDELPK